MSEPSASASPGARSPAPALSAEFRLAPSDIAGQGVFAAVPLAAGTVVAGPLNHSCDPNCWYDSDALVTRRPIEAGEELTYDYATGRDDADLVLYCHCETYRCRQIVTGDDWTIGQLQLRYSEHWAPPVRRRIESRGTE